MPDDAAGMRLLVEHLVERGRRRVAYVGGRAEEAASVVRHDTLVAELRSRGLELVGPPLYGDWSEQWGRRAVDLVLGPAGASAGGPTGGAGEVDAIVFASDQLARGGCDRLREHGLRVPDDVAVTGYDDWEVMWLASRPPLTTVDMQMERPGQRAAELLIAAIEGDPAHGVERLAPRLVVRASTLGNG
ncbi:LacI family DNA-binding transcriptional regulator [Promicromonospora iranensis]|uniref:DNA-binding LacI/PurR family transcriptional regulator n=1 Tax=Promicromonospora iranensis TaxID=1105144 RepID=A0ABU2CK54_9MICO|nr:substrate-binding domain-containing protein [Promicromonospora iranensis]MDR7381706.1 DNA-binding LacI/PurR family transcriptional regulator [Promicromonospora iranensis]